MGKNFIKTFLSKLRLVHHWYLLGLFVIFLVITLVNLRQNNLTALKLRDDVSVADEKNGDVELALQKLRTYMYSHMNTNLASGPNAIRPPIQLKYRYDRLVAAEKDRVSKTNEKVYTDAQATCEKQFPTGLSGGGRVPCIKDYVDKNGAKEKSIPDGLYKFDFVSPRWSSDIAGWSMLLAAISLVLFVIRFVLERWYDHELRRL